MFKINTCSQLLPNYLNKHPLTTLPIKLTTKNLIPNSIFQPTKLHP